MGEGEPVGAQPRLLRLELAAAAWSSESAPLAQCRSSAPAPSQGTPGGSELQLGTPGGGRATERPATASGARASRLQSRRFHLAPLTTQALR